MIIYGYYFKRIAVQRFRSADGTEMQIVIYCKLHHVMYIPTFAGHKVAVVENIVPNGEAYDPEVFGVAEDAQRLLNSSSKPWYSYIGALMFLGFVLLMSIAVFTSEKDRKDKKQYALNNIYEAQILLIMKMVISLV